MTDPRARDTSAVLSTSVRDATLEAGRMIGLGLATIGLSIFSLGAGWAAFSRVVTWQLPVAAVFAACVIVGLVFDLIEPVAGSSPKPILARSLIYPTDAEAVVFGSKYFRSTDLAKVVIRAGVGKGYRVDPLSGAVRTRGRSETDPSQTSDEI